MTPGPWALAIMAGLAVAVALIAIPRFSLFEDAARDTCLEAGEGFVGLDGGAGRYADPVPEGTRCLGPDDSNPREVEVDFFAGSEPLDSLLAWVYRLACLLAPLATTFFIGTRMSRA
jgi:hypothetical protein